MVSEDIAKGRLILCGKYRGGPAIRICVVGKENVDPRYRQGHPDLHPVVVLLQLRNSATKKEKFGALISLHISPKQLHKYLSELFRINQSNLQVELDRSPPAPLPSVDNTTLSDCGVTSGALLIVNEGPGDAAPPLRSFDAGSSGGVAYGPAPPPMSVGCGRDDDEELQRAIAMSIEDQGISAGSGEEGIKAKGFGCKDYAGLVDFIKKRDTNCTLSIARDVVKGVQLQEEFKTQMSTAQRAISQKRIKLHNKPMHSKREAKAILRALIGVEALANRAAEVKAPVLSVDGRNGNAGAEASSVAGTDGKNK